MTHPSLDFKMPDYIRAIKMIEMLWEKHSSYMRKVLDGSRYPLAKEDYLGILSNLLEFIKQ